MNSALSHGVMATFGFLSFLLMKEMCLKLEKKTPISPKGEYLENDTVSQEE